MATTPATTTATTTTTTTTTTTNNQQSTTNNQRQRGRGEQRNTADLGIPEDNATSRNEHIERNPWTHLFAMFLWCLRNWL